MPKVPSKPSTVLAPPSIVKKKVASKPQPPKIVFKKGVTDLVEVIAIAADLEGIWPKDLIRFSDLRSKYGLPDKIGDSVITRAKLRHREHIREMYVRHSGRNKSKLIESKPKLIAKKKKPESQPTPKSVSQPTIGLSPMGPIGVKKKASLKKR